MTQIYIISCFFQAYPEFERTFQENMYSNKCELLNKDPISLSKKYETFTEEKLIALEKQVIVGFPFIGQNYYILPFSFLYFAILWAQTINYFYIAFIVTYQIGFIQSVLPGHIILESISLIISCGVCIAKLRIPVISIGNNYNWNLCCIFCNNGILFELFGILPFNIIALVDESTDYKIIAIFRILRLVCLANFYSQCIKVLYKKHPLQFYFLYVFFHLFIFWTFIVHFLSCFWGFMTNVYHSGSLPCNYSNALYLTFCKMLMRIYISDQVIAKGFCYYSLCISVYLLSFFWTQFNKKKYFRTLSFSDAEIKLSFQKIIISQNIKIFSCFFRITIHCYYFIQYELIFCFKIWFIFQIIPYIANIYFHKYNFFNQNVYKALQNQYIIYLICCNRTIQQIIFEQQYYCIFKCYQIFPIFGVIVNLVINYFLNNMSKYYFIHLHWV